MNKIIREAFAKTRQKIEQMTAEEVERFLDPVEYGPIALGISDQLIERAMEYKVDLQAGQESFTIFLDQFNVQYVRLHCLNSPTSMDGANDPFYFSRVDEKVHVFAEYQIAA